MKLVLRFRSLPLAALAVLLCSGPALWARDSFARVAREVNQKLVKVYGAGGFQGLPAYGTGILVSPQGHILTAASQLLDTADLRVHLYDGRRFDHVKVLVIEPALDVALLQIQKLDKNDPLPYFDVAQAAKQPLASAGDWILAFSNQFEIATRDEPMSVQRGVVAAHTRLRGRKGVFQVAYQGDVYIIDAITNNPGAAGGAITTANGQLLGLIGKELRNTLTDTWINYAVPIQDLANFVEQAKAGKYKVKGLPERLVGQPPFTGIIFVPNVVETTPPFVDDVIPESPAARAGLRPDDLVVYVEGQQVVSIKAFRDLISQFQPGTTVTMEIRRLDSDHPENDRLVTAKLTLAQQPTKPKPASGKK